MSEPSSGAPSLNGRLAGAHPAVSSNGARRPERVLVVGGGAVGLCVAEALLSRGAAVTLLERERCGAGASTGNAGWVTPSLAIPVPAPGVIGESLRWLINPSGPLWIRPTLSRHMIAWISHFMASCSQATHRRGLRALQAAARDAGESFDALAGRGVHFELHAEGLLYPALEQAELQLLLGMLRALERAGARDIPDRLGPAELLELEPALHPRVVGGVFARGERGVRPESLVAGLQGAVTELGGEIVQGAAVTGLAREGAGWRVQTPAGPRRGDAVVLANGVAAVGLLAGLGGRVPLVAAKGYSRTYAADPTGPRRNIYLEGPRVAISSYDGATRVSGTLELGARGLGLSARRLDAISTGAAHALPGWRMPAQPFDWAGMRSMTPDGLPLIGALPGIDGVYIASGHATLGITLAPLSGRLLADLIVDQRRDPLLDAFAPGRFMRGAGRAGASTATVKPHTPHPALHQEGTP